MVDPAELEARLAAGDPLLGLTVRVVHARMAPLGLWRFVAREDGSGVGTFHFRCDHVAALRAELAGRADFRAPPGKDGRWEASERAFGLSLHLKHFAGWPEDKIQAHVDRYGAWLPGNWRWLLPVQLYQWLRHWAAYDSYRDVERLAGTKR